MIVEKKSAKPYEKRTNHISGKRYENWKMDNVTHRTRLACSVSQDVSLAFGVNLGDGYIKRQGLTKIGTLTISVPQSSKAPSVP